MAPKIIDLEAIVAPEILIYIPLRGSSGTHSQIDYLHIHDGRKFSSGLRAPVEKLYALTYINTMLPDSECNRADKLTGA
uniref:Uncharacterized protein n=1 Tax=Romanomermis culicivorax TaxID=13658 RepID=A0A915L0A5_ROMCU